MKRLAILLVSLTAIAPHGVALADATVSPTQVEVEGRIERVIDGLLPDTAFENRFDPKASLDLDEDVNRYLTSWKVPPSGSWQATVTLRHLLSHSAGRTVHGFPGYRTTETLPTVIDILQGRPPSNTPRFEVNVLPGIQTTNREVRSLTLEQSGRQVLAERKT